MTVLFVVACHFKSRNELCDTTISRLEKALSLYEQILPEETIIIVGGAVPYEKGGPTLQYLMKQWLISHKVAPDSILFNRGTGTFSEARETTKEIFQMCGGNGNWEIQIISSDWWLWSGKIIWKGFAKARGLRVRSVSIPNTGGWRTRLVYALYGAVVHASFAFGISHLVEKRLDKMQEKRLEGFTWDGCA